MERVLVESAIRAVLLAIAAAAVLRVLRITTASGRHATWTVVLLAMLTLPMWTLWGPKAALPVLPTRSGGSVAVPSAGVEHVPFVAPAGESQSVTPGDVSPAHVATPPASNMSWRTIALAIYGLGVIILLGRLIVGTVRAQRIIRRAELHAGQLTSRQCSAPVTVGWFHPVVMLPDDWNRWSPAQLDAVLLHEREHARRRDPLIQWVALLNRAVFWFHPLAWWLERRLAALAEDACDAAVLARGHQPAEYCEYLLSLARTVTGAGVRVDIVGAAMPSAFLPQRIRRILKAGPESRITGRRLAWALLTCAGVSVAVTAATLVPAQSRAGTTVTPPAAGGQNLPDYWFDDDEWHLETAPLLTADELRAYMRLKTSARRDSFIADFWRSRDPTPKTPANEFRREFERRIRFAKERFAEPDSAATFGYQTDRGRWYVSVGPPDEMREFASNRGTEQESRVEEWRYKALDEFGGDVAVKFDPSADFSCSWRGGKYRIESPAAVQRFEGVSSVQAARRPFALTYPNHYVYLSFPIDKEATAIKWQLRGPSHDTADLLVIQHIAELLGERGPFGYVQGELGESKGREPILTHLARYRFFESEGFACTEPMLPGEYTLSIDSTLRTGGTRADSVTFVVK